MRLKGIRWVVGKLVERCFPYGHKAVVISDLTLCTIEMSSVLAVTLTQGIGFLLLFSLTAAVIEVAGRRVQSTGTDADPKIPPVAPRRVTFRPLSKARMVRWLKSPGLLRSRRKASASLSPCKVNT